MVALKGSTVVCLRAEIPADLVVRRGYAMRSQKMKSIATQRKILLRNWSSWNWGVPGAGAGGLPVFKLLPFVKVEAKKPKGNAPIPNDI